MNTGIYQIRNTLNGNRYIGSTVSFSRRFALHRRDLQKRGHHAVALQRAWEKYGENAFVFEPLLVCAEKDLLFYEQLALDNLRPKYNSAKKAGSTLGLIISPEGRARMSEGQKGKVFSEEHRRKLSEKLTGRPCSPKALAALRGNKGRKHSPETVEKNRQAHTGFRHSDAAKKKLSALWKGREFSPEHRKKLSEAASSRAQPVQSEETRKKRSDAMKAYWRRIKA